MVSHLAISLGRTEWFDEVPEADYDTATANRVGA